MNTNAHDILSMVHEAATVYRLPADEIIGPCRHRLAFAARSEVIGRAREHGFSLTFLSQFFRRDHTSILNSERHYKAQADLVPVFRSRRAK